MVELEEELNDDDLPERRHRYTSTDRMVGKEVVWMRPHFTLVDDEKLKSM